MAYEHMGCRLDGHAWEETSVSLVADTEGLVIRVITCLRGVGTEREHQREDVIDRRTGHVVHRRYVMPKTYRVVGRISRDAWRFEYLKGVERPKKHRARRKEVA
jgi:hypothetical protein